MSSVSHYKQNCKQNEKNSARTRRLSKNTGNTNNWKLQVGPAGKWEARWAQN